MEEVKSETEIQMKLLICERNKQYPTEHRLLGRVIGDTNGIPYQLHVLNI